MKKGYRIGANPQTVAFFHFSALNGQANMNTPPTMQIVASWFVWLSFGGPNRDRTDDLTDANAFGNAICGAFWLFSALSSGKQMVLCPLVPNVPTCPGNLCGIRCGHRSSLAGVSGEA